MADDVAGTGADSLRESVGEVARSPRDDQRALDPANLQRLWSPWRFGYISEGTRTDGCPFCELPARGSERDRESLIVHRGQHAYVIFNAYPYNPGHLMVCPYEHLGELEDLPDEVAAEIWQLGRRAVAVLKERVFCQGVNLGMNLGSAGGAGIAEHLHLHAVPRWSGDTNFISVLGSTRVLPRALEEMYDEVAPGFA